MASSISRYGLASILLVAVLIGAETVPLAAMVTEQMDKLNTKLNTIMDETMSYLDRAWEIAKKFRDPEYDYDPSELGNFTIPEGPTK